jgi:hypothetical protein
MYVPSVSEYIKAMNEAIFKAREENQQLLASRLKALQLDLIDAMTKSEHYHRQKNQSKILD